MIIVVDTNIIFSGILSPNGTISDILLNSTDTFDFYAPTFILEELEKHHQKLMKISKLSENDLNFLKRIILKRIELIDIESIRPETWEKALYLAKDIDEFDTPFIALCLELDSPLWSGDKKLLNGLKRKGIDWGLDTNIMLTIRNDIK
ncbi:PIN domain-containing protein [Abyssalbus ytuae]|uniref:PIN domain-containing protein n=1 Tax=Abyssalbus ytuae TaxID=2926907 RepID=A0A9E7CYS6_9FLAO|nr:PIN domain-containing protein [Abyssalbus ytuae]UOB16945.1 PIN domain-containing protein [Abyssalbus ytuae]